MSTEPDPIDRAISRMIPHGAFCHGARILSVAILLRKEEWRLLRAPWWHGKDVHIIGVDLDGNFFLRHSGGSVRWWSHQEQAEEEVAPSVNEFARKIKPMSETEERYGIVKGSGG